MAQGKIKIKVDTGDLERLVQLQCQATKCRFHKLHNVYNGAAGFTCNLKQLCMGPTGLCQGFEEVEGGE